MSALLDSSHYTTAIRIEPPFGMLCIGWHGASGRIRAVDAFTRRVGWEAPPSVVVEPTARAIAIAGGRAYVAHENTLSALDLATGTLGWQVQLDADVQVGFGRPCIADPYPRTSPGILVVQLTDEQHVGLDRATGALRWTLPEAKDFGPFAVAGGVIVVAKFGDRLQLLFLDPLRGPEPVCAIPSPFAQFRLHGRNVLLGAADIDSYGNAGVAVVEMPTGRVLLRAPAPFDDHRGPPVLAGSYVWSADLIRFAGSPNGPVAPPEIIPGHNIDRLESTGTTLIGLFDTVRGTSRLRLAGFDPRTLAVRYATGVDLGARPTLANDASNLAALGPLVAVAGRREGDAEQDLVVLTVVHGDTGQLVWSRTVPGRIERLDAAGNVFVLRTDRQTLAFRPDHPEPVGTFPFEP